MLSFVRMIAQRIDLYTLSYLGCPESGVQPRATGQRQYHYGRYRGEYRIYFIG
jgi:hypothetical protein